MFVRFPLLVNHPLHIYTHSSRQDEPFQQWDFVLKIWYYRSRTGFYATSASVKFNGICSNLRLLTQKATALHASHFNISGIHGLWASSSSNFGVLNLIEPAVPSSLWTTLLWQKTHPIKAAITRKSTKRWAIMQLFKVSLWITDRKCGFFCHCQLSHFALFWANDS